MSWALLFSWLPVLKRPTACQVPAFLGFHFPPVLEGDLPDRNPSKGQGLCKQTAWV